MRRLLWTAIFAHVAILTVLPVLPAQVPALLGPSPLLAQAVATDERARVVVDTAVLMRDLRILAADSMEGRAVGTPGNAKARAHLLRRFSEVQLRPFGSSFEKPFTFTPRGSEQQQRGVNVVGYIRGTASPERYIVVTAHYDHLGISNGEIFNGADDNASGTAALFAVAEHFRRDPAAHSLIIAALDAEEVGLRGAHAFVQDPPVDRAAIVANVNMDMVGRNDAGELWAAGTYHNPGLRPLVERLAGRAPVTLRIGHDRPNVPGEDDWTNASDHGPFHAAGIPFLYFGVEDHEDYHRPTDDFERVDPGELAASVRTILLAVRALDAALPLDLARQ